MTSSTSLGGVFSRSKGVGLEFGVRCDVADSGGGLRGVDFLDDQTLLVAPEWGNALLTFTLDPTLLRELALEKLNRRFRPEECRTYDVDPCPTLDEMRARR